MQKAPDIVERRIEGRTLLFPVRRGKEGLWLYELNETAAFVWENLDRAAGDEELVATVSRHFEAPENEIREDLAHLLSELRAIGALL